MKKNSPSQTRSNMVIVLLLQAIAYSGLWLWDEYIASYFTLIIPGIILVILTIATISDLIEPSRIPGWYYTVMLISIITPVLIGAIFYYLYDGHLDWLA